MINKKVLILVNHEIVIYNFRRELVERLIEEGYEVHLSCPYGEKIDRLKEIGCKFIDTPIDRRTINPIADYKLIKNYKNIVKKIKPDIVLSYTIKPNVYGNYIASKYSVPVISNVTGIGTSMISHKLKFIIKFLYRYACKKSKIVYFQNTDNRNYFYDNKLVEKSKAKLLPGSGVNLQEFIPLSKTGKDEKIKFLFIGRLMKEKGIEEFIIAADNISKNYSNVIFQAVGAFEEEKFEEVINNNQNIQYLGKSTDVRKEIREVDCIINPTYHEGMSNVLLEGAAMGKPLLASNIPGCKEIVEDRFNGFLFEPKSALILEESIIKFIELSDEEKVIMGKNSREKVEKEFDRNIVVNEYMKKIEDILDWK